MRAEKIKRIVSVVALVVSVASLVVIAIAIHDRSQPFFDDGEIRRLANSVRDSTGHAKEQNAQLFYRISKARLEKGMRKTTRATVRKELGEPDRVDVGDCFWEYYLEANHDERTMSSLLLVWQARWNDILIGIQLGDSNFSYEEVLGHENGEGRTQ